MIDARPGDGHLPRSGVLFYTLADLERFLRYLLQPIAGAAFGAVGGVGEP